MKKLESLEASRWQAFELIALSKTKGGELIANLDGSGGSCIDATQGSNGPDTGTFVYDDEGELINLWLHIE